MTSIAISSTKRFRATRPSTRLGFDEGSEVGVRSLSDSSYDRRSPASEKSEPLSREIAESTEERDAPEAIEVPEAGPVPPAEEISYSSKKKDKKSKIAAKRALYEET